MHETHFGDEHLTFAALHDDPYPLLARLRDETPVRHAPAMGMWLVTRRDLILTVLRDPATFTVERDDSPIRDTFGRHMLSTDGERQRRDKSACAPPFNARAVREDAGPAVAHECERLLERLAGSVTGDIGWAELRGALAGPLAVFSVAHLLGLPVGVHATLRGWYDDFAAALADFDPTSRARARGRARAEEFRRVVRWLVRRARDEGEGAVHGRTLLGALARGESSGNGGSDRLDDEAICANALIVLFGGIETTEAAILNATWSLLAHPAQAELVRREPSLLPNAIEESLRWEPAVQTCHRYATRDVVLGGVTVPAGATVQCMIGGANRDPAHFEEPDVFDVHRANASDHLAFGVGRHFCLGAALARREVQLALGGLLARFPTIALDSDRPCRPEGHEFRKPPELWVRWDSGERHR